MTLSPILGPFDDIEIPLLSSLSKLVANPVHLSMAKFQKSAHGTPFLFDRVMVPSLKMERIFIRFQGTVFWVLIWK